ncbi:hypothetical protein CBR_g23413 [Chara braunii]|uniref:Uncharacterized protein n=1 Tax=Chara braunii TaxID=69332 RepID=A0A388L462_CHABU|nr:hypothetical protein CBR_g23413 [Chara braunii]|eukprot:GBG77087.1 hypothetical protein CBR_g23413 [Chara braunii]
MFLDVNEQSRVVRCAVRILSRRIVETYDQIQLQDQAMLKIYMLVSILNRHSDAPMKLGRKSSRPVLSLVVVVVVVVLVLYCCCCCSGPSLTTVLICVMCIRCPEETYALGMKYCLDDSGNVGFGERSLSVGFAMFMMGGIVVVGISTHSTKMQAPSFELKAHYCHEVDPGCHEWASSLHNFDGMLLVTMVVQLFVDLM